MSQRNKTTIRRYLDEVASEGNLDVIEELFTSDYVNHQPNGHVIRSLDEFRQIHTMYHAAFEDRRVTLHHILAEEDRIAFHSSTRVRHVGEFMGVAPTNKELIFTGVNVSRMVDGKFAESWVYFDPNTVFKQLGVEPPADKVPA